MNKPKFPIKIKSMTMCEVSGLPEQERAHFQFEHGNLPNSMEFGNAAVVSSTEVARHLPGFFGYSAKAVHSRPIPGGWAAPRCIFDLVLEIENAMGFTTDMTVNGYTDRLPNKEGLANVEGMYWDWSDVSFHVNGFQTQRRLQMRTPEGPVTTHQVVDSHQLIFDNDYCGVTKQAGNSIRPADVFATMGSMDVLFGNGSVSDTRTMITSIPVVSDRNNVIPSEFLSNVIRNYAQALETEEFGGSHDQMLSQARGAAMEPTLNQNPFFNALTMVKGMSFNGRFKLEDLTHIDPQGNVMGKAMYVVIPQKEQQSLNTGTSAWHAASLLVGQAVPAIMSRLGMAKVIFSATNNTPDHHAKIAIIDEYSALSPTTHSDEKTLELFKNQLIHEVFDHFSFGDLLAFELEVYSVPCRMTTVTIGEIGGEKHTRELASFADALFSPMTFDIADEKDRLNLVSDIDAMLSQLNLS